MILLAVILMDILTGMEFDLFVPSFPELKQYFHVSPFLLELSISANFIGYCLSLFIVGELADRYGRKPIIILGLIIFIVGSILCLKADFYYFFLLGRFLQGFGIAAPAILSFLVIADLYTVKKQQFLMAMLNASMNTAVALAPVIGSYITKYFHWEGNFYTLLSLGIFVFLITLIFVPNAKSTSSENESILQGYKAILKSNMTILLAIYFIITFVPYWIFVGISPLLYMNDLHISLEHFGYYQGSLALVFAFGSLLFGLIIHRFNHKTLLLVANIIFILSLSSMLYVTFWDGQSALLITLTFILLTIGGIIPGNILYPLYLNLMPKAKGRLTALTQGGRLIFASLGLQLVGLFYKESFYSTGIIVSGFVFLGIVMMVYIIKHWNLINTKSV